MGLGLRWCEVVVEGVEEKGVGRVMEIVQPILFFFLLGKGEGGWGGHCHAG